MIVITIILTRLTANSSDFRAKQSAFYHTKELAPRFGINRPISGYLNLRLSRPLKSRG